MAKGLLTGIIAPMGKRLYSLDQTFFDMIDTEAKAYFFGLLCADGYNNEHAGSVTLKLQSRDRALVYAFRKAVGFGGKVVRIIPTTNFTGKVQRQFECRISSRKLSRALAAAGCGQRKSHTLAFPTTVPLPLMRHFIRGYWDGDGCIMLHERRPPWVSAISSLAFCQGLRDFFAAHLGIKSAIRRDHSVYSISVYRLEHVKTLCTYLYDDASTYLARKRDKFLLAAMRESRRKKKRPAEEVRKIRAAQATEWRRANLDAAKARDKRSRERHREKRIATTRRWREENREKVLAYSRHYDKTRRKRDLDARRLYNREWMRRYTAARRLINALIGAA